MPTENGTTKSTLPDTRTREVRLRLGADRYVGAPGKLNASLTFQTFASDEGGGRNLLQAGNRVMVDAGCAFRAGAQTWTL